MTVEEARAAPNVVASTFMVNYVLALVFFDAGVIRSFVSTYFCRGFSIACKALDPVLKVSIVDDRTVLLFKIY